MKRFFKVLFIIFFCFVGIVSLTVFTILIIPPKIKFDEKLLVKSSNFTVFYDRHNNVISYNNDNQVTLKYEDLNENIINAFIAIEDKNFFKHNGLDYLRMVKATMVNIKNHSFKQGASTISQQLIKNTHLSNEKTIARKINEIKLVKTLEKNFSKNQIITMYLNSIYFGENKFGIYNASKHYFNKEPFELTLSEVATLAGIISAPSKLNPISNYYLAVEKRNLVLTKMENLGYITKDEKQNAINEELTIYNQTNDYKNPYIKACLNEIEELNLSIYQLQNCKIFTNLDENLQEQISSYEIENDYQAIVIDNNTSEITAYYSTCGEIKREIASCAKPILVYAPALEENYINQYSKIVDEEINFSGYKPKNYGDKYYGEVTIHEALVKSLNVPAVKILDSIGVKKAKLYGEKLNIKVVNDGLGVALGNLGCGVKLKDLTGAYMVFANFGTYKKPFYIKKIIDNNGKVVYNHKEDTKKVFSPSTCSVINNILKDCAKCGTAKKLSFINYDIACKTGTNGTSAGNTDCYSVAYTSYNSFGVWIGNRDNSILKNNETGSNTPTSIIGQISQYVSKNNLPPSFEQKDLEEIIIDKISYENDGKFLIADKNSPLKYTQKLFVKKENIPKEYSQRFSSFENLNIDISMKDNMVTFSTNLPEYVTFDIIKLDNGTKKIIYSGNQSYTETLTNQGIYDYFAVFHLNGVETISSNEIKLKSVKYDKTADKNPVDRPEDWWLD